MSFLKRIRMFIRNQRLGIVMIGGILIASIGLSAVTGAKYDAIDRRGGPMSRKDYEEKKKEDLEWKEKEFNLEEEYEKMQKRIDLNQWENKRIKRAGEDDIDI
eukprot:TRINITY_DN735_c0_g2_i3.p1 TRINITY_DN735_c0_g2~~TRINITY_DN735_c0_g2_i3.p1  ORF type:complete len:103 (+),score=32.87 TRINITY_DN735_c0_g2_i3:123-431(+)